MRIILIYTFGIFFSFCTRAQSTNAYNFRFCWLIDSVKLVSWLDVLKSDIITEFEFNEDNQMIKEVHFFKDSSIAYKAVLNDVFRDTLLFKKQRNNEVLVKQSGEVDTSLFIEVPTVNYFESEITFYPNGMIRSEYFSSKNRIESKAYTNRGKLIYSNLVIENGGKWDTLEGFLNVYNRETGFEEILVYQNKKRIFKILHQASVPGIYKDRCLYNHEFCLIGLEPKTLGRRKIIRKIIKANRNGLLWHDFILRC